MRGPISIENPENFPELIREYSQRVTGDIIFVLGSQINVNLYLVNIIDLIRIRTWLYPGSTVAIIGFEDRQVPFTASFENGTLSFFATNNITDTLMSSVWSSSITSVPFLSFDPSFLNELFVHFPGLQEVNLDIDPLNVGSLVEAQIEYPFKIFRGVPRS